MSIATTLSAIVPDSVKDVLEKLMVAVEAFWRENQLPTKKAVGVTQRLLRLSERIEELLERHRAGKLKQWRRRAAPMAADAVAKEALAEAEMPLDPSEAEAAADAALQAARAKLARPRTELYGLPPHHGWLNEQLPNVAVFVGSDLQAAFSTEEMRALMLKTPVVARLAGPVFRMLGLDEQVLLVPEGYTDPALSKNRKFYAPERKHPKQESDYKPDFIVPAEYDEDRDGRKPHPLRQPDWNYRAYVDYRSYLYFYMRRKPAHMQAA